MNKFSQKSARQNQIQIRIQIGSQNKKIRKIKRKGREEKAYQTRP
jgi:hypothetical protein